MCKLARLVFLFTALISLAACSGEPWTLSRSADHITLRWWSDEIADAQGADTAGAYCTQMRKSMETVSIERDGSAAIGKYRCI